MKEVKCRGCGRRYRPTVSRQKSCSECRRLIVSVKQNSNVLEFERLREEFNRKNGCYLTYGEFVAWLDSLSRRCREKR